LAPDWLSTIALYPVFKINLNIAINISREINLVAPNVGNADNTTFLITIGKHLFSILFRL